MRYTTARTCFRTERASSTVTCKSSAAVLPLTATLDSVSANRALPEQQQQAPCMGKSPRTTPSHTHVAHSHWRKFEPSSSARSSSTSLRAWLGQEWQRVRRRRQHSAAQQLQTNTSPAEHLVCHVLQYQAASAVPVAVYQAHHTWHASAFQSAPANRLEPGHRQHNNNSVTA